MADPQSVDEKLDVRRRRVRYRAWHRGMLEMDMIMGHFTDAHASEWDHATLDRFERLMEEQDADLLKWVLGQEQPPETVDAALIADLADFQKSFVSPQ